MAQKLTRKQRSDITKFKKVWDESVNYLIRQGAHTRKEANARKRKIIARFRAGGSA